MILTCCIWHNRYFYPVTKTSIKAPNTKCWDLGWTKAFCWVLVRTLKSNKSQCIRTGDNRQKNNLFSLSGTKWKNRRKLFANNFHFKTLDMYNNSINKNSRVLVKKLLEASANDKQISNVMKYVTLCSLDIIGGNY